MGLIASTVVMQSLGLNSSNAHLHAIICACIYSLSLALSLALSLYSMIYFLPNLFFALSRGTQADPAEEPTVAEEPAVESGNAAAESAKAEAEAAAAKKAADEVQPLGAYLFCCWI